MKISRLSRVRSVAVTLAVALILAFTIRQAVALPVRVATPAVEPELTDGSFALVYRLDRQFEPGDVLAYRSGGRIWLGRFVAHTASGEVELQRNDEYDHTVPPKTILGRVILSTR